MLRAGVFFWLRAHLGGRSMTGWGRWAAALAAAGAAASSQANAAEPLVAALTGGKPLLEMRLRYEGVDQAGFAKDAAAVTLRTRLGYETGSWNNLKALAEVEDVRPLGPQDFNSTTNGRTSYPVVPDPEGTELNRLQLTWTPSKTLTATLGRQRILLDDQRFVGPVAWRQDEQTFDAARADVAMGDFKFTAAWLDRVNRVFAESADWRSDSWLVNASYGGLSAVKPTAFLYALDFDNAPASSSLTYGVRVTGKRKVGGVRLTFAGAYARQTDYGNNPARFDLDYWMAETAATWGVATLKANYESLEGDGRRGFATPLATLHAFQGWADVFLTTPANGIEDANLSLALTPKIEGLPPFALMVVAHDFKAQRGGADLGDEIDVQLTAPLTKRLTGLVKYADYDGIPGYASRTKLWVGVDFKY